MISSACVIYLICLECGVERYLAGVSCHPQAREPDDSHIVAARYTCCLVAGANPIPLENTFISACGVADGLTSNSAGFLSVDCDGT